MSGEHTSASHTQSIQSGSPPHERGALLNLIHDDPRPGITPA